MQKNSQEHCQLQARDRTGQDKVYSKDQDEVKFKVNVGMNVKSCADNTSDRNPATMTVKDIRGRLDRILAMGV